MISVRLLRLYRGRDRRHSFYFFLFSVSQMAAQAEPGSGAQQYVDIMIVIVIRFL